MRYTLVLSAFAFLALTDCASAQFQCSPTSCIDPRTGYYTQSTCDRYGCRPLGGIVGRTNPGQGGWGGGLYGGSGRGHRGGGYQGGYGGVYEGGGVDCNRSRCIVNGELWESTCDRGGCRPLRPARRGRRW